MDCISCEVNDTFTIGWLMVMSPENQTQWWFSAQGKPPTPVLEEELAPAQCSSHGNRSVWAEKGQQECRGSSATPSPETGLPGALGTSRPCPCEEAFSWQQPLEVG